ncbi:MAG: hypothetical protein AAF571_12310 [Verrucomicrobiota bacterium]
MKTNKYIYTILLPVTAAGACVITHIFSDGTAPSIQQSSTEVSVSESMNSSVTSAPPHEQSAHAGSPGSMKHDELKHTLSAKDSDGLLRLLREDTHLTLSHIAQFGETYDSSLLSKTVFDYLISLENWEKSLNLLKSIQADAAWYHELLASSVEHYGQNDYMAACRWLAKHSYLSGAPVGAEMLGRLAGHTRDPRSELEQTKPLWSSDDLLAHYYKGLTGTWAEQDLDAAMEFMNSTPQTPVMDLAIHDFVVNIGIQVDPAITMSWAESVTDKELQQSAVIQTAGMMLEQNTENYRLWRLNTQLPPQIENNLP